MTNTDNNGFTLYKTFPNGGSVLLMSGLDTTTPDYNDLLTIGCLFAKEGKEVKVLSSIHYKDSRYHEVYGSLIGTMYYRKCPDLLVDGDFYEYESYNGPFEMGKVVRMIGRGSKQSSDIVIDVRESTATKAGITNRIRELKMQKTFKCIISSVWLYDGQSVELVYKTSRGASPSTSAEKSLRITNP